MTSPYIHTIGSGYPLVLIPGWGWNSAVWDLLTPQLETRYQLFLVDLPGTGKSPTLSGSYDFPSLFMQLQNHVPEQAAWLGWSLGGLFCQWIAIHRPKAISHLITVASTPKFIAEEGWLGIQAHVLDQFSAALHENYQQTLEDFLELQLRGCQERSQLKSNLTACLQQNLWTTSALDSGLTLLKETDLRRHLHQITCPSLHIFGQLDTLVPASVAPFFKSQLPRAHCEIIRRTGHIPFLTHPSIFLEQLFNLMAQ